MNPPEPQSPFIAIACGGTGGHLFPGLAVAHELQQYRCDVALLVSPKEVDREAVKSAPGMEILTLPAVALQGGNYFSFAASGVKSLFAARKLFRRHRPQAVLAMGGFTSAAPLLVAKAMGVKTFLHESNSFPGRANRLLSRFVDGAFIGFPEAGAHLKARKVTVTGTPVRPQFQPRDPAACRAALGLDPDRLTILVVGGSQGASGLNEMILSALPRLAGKNWQWLHLTGSGDFAKMRAAYAARGIKAVVKPFLPEMDLALNAATAAVSRAGASSLAEMAAMRLPSLLVPFPAAADNHQFLNAAAFAQNGAARLLEQRDSTPERLAAMLTELAGDSTTRSSVQRALAQRHVPRAAEQIAERMLDAVARRPATVPGMNADCGCGHAHGPAKPATG